MDRIAHRSTWIVGIVLLLLAVAVTAGSQPSVRSTLGIEPSAALPAPLPVESISDSLVQPTQPTRALSFEERVECQRRIEEVRWRYSIWPEANPTPKPALSEVLSAEATRSKVEDALRKSSALEVYWQRPITAAQLQAEMERMARGTRHAELLLDLFAALDNDPFLIAECLARPVLSDRLLRNWYAYDSRFHGDVGAAAESAMAGGVTASELPAVAERYEEVTFEKAGLEDEDRPPGDRGALRLDVEEWSEELRRLAGRFGVGRAAEPQGREFGAAVAETAVGADEEIEALFAEIPVGEVSALEETADGWRAVTVLSKSEGSIRLGIAQWPKLAFSTWWAAARDDLAPGVEPLAGAYTVATVTGDAGCTPDTWTISVHDEAPASRGFHTAVWTGDRMIVWGGEDPVTNTGGIYDPGTDSWTPTSVEGAPSERAHHTAVWTGDRMIVWGGGSNTGGVYDPVTDSWVPTSVEGAPSGPLYHTAVWTGDRMIVWGGWSMFLFNTGGVYDPVTDSWTPTSLEGAPAERENHTAVWTGDRMIVWGGFGGGTTGGVYDPGTNSWTATSVEGAPEGRYSHTAVWTGDRMIVWGGGRHYYYGWEFEATGGVYDPGTDSWTPTSLEGAPSERFQHTAVWTGDHMIVWGGGKPSTDTGGLYHPGTDSWTPTSVEGAPSAREYHTAVWTGDRMIVWGGAASNQLGSYCPPARPIFISPECGSTLLVEPGETVEFTVTAEDLPERTVTLDASGLPPDAMMDPALPTTGNPVSSDFTWETDAGDDDTTQIITFTATNDHALDPQTAACELTLVTTHGVTKLLPSDGHPGQHFGDSIAVSDGLAVVGAPGDNEVAVNAGAAYVFRHDGERWIEVQKLLASDGYEKLGFGSAVAVSGGLVAVAAPGDQTFEGHAGAVYVFEYDGTGWTEKAKVLPSEACRSSGGCNVDGPVAVSGDLVAFFERVFYTCNYWGNTGFDEEVRFVHSDGSGFSAWGSSESDLGSPLGDPDDHDVALQDRLAEDGPAGAKRAFGDVAWSGSFVDLTKSYCEDYSGWYPGAEMSESVHVRIQDGTGWIDLGSIVSRHCDCSQGEFGGYCSEGCPDSIDRYYGPWDPAEVSSLSAVAVVADLVVVGAPGEEAVHVFRCGAGGCIEDQTLVAPVPGGVFAEFGEEVAASDDMILVGASGDKEITVFGHDGADWVAMRTLIAPDGFDGDGFPGEMAVSGNQVIVGASTDDDNGVESGSAYVFDLGHPTFTSPECGSTIRVEPGDTVEFTVSVEDAAERSVTLDASGLPPDATMDPGLPTTGNPVSSDFTWTTDDSHNNTGHIVEFTATNDEGLFARCRVGIEVGDYTLVTLVSFTAIPGDGQVTLHWTTASEIDNAGFYLLRSIVATRGTARLLKGLIPARGDVFTGADYTFVDETAVNGVEYAYTLVDVDLYGIETHHPPVRATPNPPSPPVKLLSPARREASYPTTATFSGYAEGFVRSIEDE